MKKLAEEEKIFLACLRYFLKGEKGLGEEIRSYLEKEINWYLILSWAHWHGVTPLIYHILKEVNWAGIPKPIRERLERSFWVNTARNLFLSAEIDKVFAALGKRGIMSIPIKGIFLSEEVYPDISFRMITDIDLLIRGEDLMRAEKSLIELGYCRDYPLRECLFPENCYTLHMEKGDRNGQKLCVELHWGLANRRDYTLPMERWWEKISSMVTDGSMVTAEPKVRNGYSRNGTDCLRMRPELTLLYLTINAHMSRYSFLKQLVDIAQVIKYYEHDMDWECVTDMACELGLLDNLIFALGLVRKMFDLPIADELTHRSTSRKHRVLHSVFTEQRLVRGKMGQDLRQFFLLFLLNGNVIIHSIWKVMFPSRETVAYRYSLSPQSHSTYLYLFFNPFLSLYRLLRGCAVDCWEGKGIGRL